MALCLTCQIWNLYGGFQGDEMEGDGILRVDPRRVVGPVFVPRNGDVQIPVTADEQISPVGCVHLRLVVSPAASPHVVLPKGRIQAAATAAALVCLELFAPKGGGIIASLATDQRCVGTNAPRDGEDEKKNTTAHDGLFAEPNFHVDLSRLIPYRCDNVGLFTKQWQM